MNVSDSLFQHFLDNANRNIANMIGEIIGGVNLKFSSWEL